MPGAMNVQLDKMRSVLSTISVGQKVVIGLLVAGLLLGGVFFTQWITKPTYAPLFSNLAAADASAIVDELNAQGVENEVTDGGSTIMVPKDQVYDLRLSMAGKGLTASEETGYALLDEQGITTSEFKQQVDYQRALQGELASTLESMDGVETAVVKLAIPEDTVFTDDQGTPTASVLLDLAAGTQLSGEQVQSVTNLVSSSVEGMDAKDVTVANSEGQLLSTAGSGISAGGSDAQSQAEADYEARITANAQRMLDTVAGPGNAVVAVRADLDFDERASTEERYDYNDDTPALSESTQTEGYNGDGGNAVGGVLGPENQVGAGTGGESAYTKTDTTKNNAVDKITETVNSAGGDVKRLTVSVIMNNASAGVAPPAPNIIEDVVSQAVGLDQTRGDAITVANVAFDTSAAENAAAALAEAEAADAKAQMMSLVKTGAIALGIVLLVLIVWLRSRRGRAAEEEDEQYQELELSDEHMLELERLRVESSRDAALDARKAELEGAQRERVRSEISEMISDRPDEVAVMLRSWFAEAK
ncbi:flagellar M-ring protein FliF [Modestobacter sp. I12A-02628]|uniref:Flagellar M-ring protein n=1 Tax=Goekera deserti TaxID=2497753 RepID=A0A7K3WGN0_9ACTN|nr:flagellar basal-body MS-ring/collar protein FliF [Goekera deserti]MPQ99501.1 flagellar M-ring protein FliF [Goekera deserti]NDI48988.1 flagellar M-ring protein FliF [Goekera deserti]NEL55542.1 flagellar M-ring protein FliF [Goekera deserti]